MNLNNQIMIASGTWGMDGWGSGMEEITDYSPLGAVIPKTLTLLPQKGNAFPRWYPLSYKRSYEDEGNTTFFNSIGMPNLGLEHTLQNFLPQWKGKLGNTPLIISVAGYNATDWYDIAKILSNYVHLIDGVELNLSCPNTFDGMIYSNDAHKASYVLNYIKDITKLPVIVKLSPMSSNIGDVIALMQYYGLDAVTISNTMPAMHNLIGNRYCGLSGTPLKHINLALIYDIRKRFRDLTIIGCGGVIEQKDVDDYRHVGASSVQVGSANLIDFNIPWKLSI